MLTHAWRTAMIIEMRSYRLKPGSVAEVEKRFGEALRDRVKVSPLGAFFHTEVGPLNRIIHCWRYEARAHRTDVRSMSIQRRPTGQATFMGARAGARLCPRRPEAAVSVPRGDRTRSPAPAPIRASA